MQFEQSSFDGVLARHQLPPGGAHPPSRYNLTVSFHETATSAPWAALNAARGDVFRVRSDADGALWAQEKVEASGYCTIRVALEPDGPLRDDVGTILGKFADWGATGMGMFGLVVLDVPPDADLSSLRWLLDQSRGDGWWDYDELCVTAAWAATGSS